MTFIKLATGIFILSVLFLTGCGLFSQKENAETEQAVVSEENTDVTLAEGEVGELAFTRIPNPYESVAKPSVAAPAKAEFAKATALMEGQKWQDAEGVLVLLTETYPDLAGPFVNLGIVQSHLDKHEEAESNWLKAIEINPGNFDAYSSLGLFYRENGRFEDAEKIYLKALEVWPHHAVSVKNLGVLYDLYMGRFEAALAQYELYQKVVDEEDRKVKGWIADLNRRIAAENRKKQ